MPRIRFPIRTEIVIFHSYGGVYDPDIGLLYPTLMMPWVFMVEKLEKLFSGIFEIPGNQIYFGFEQIEGFDPMLLRDRQAFAEWLQDNRAVCWDCGGHFGNQRRIWDNDYQGRVSASARIFKALAEETGWKPHPVFQRWIDLTNTSDISYKSVGPIAKIMSFGQARLKGVGGGEMSERQTLNWLADTIADQFQLEVKIRETARQLPKHQLTTPFGEQLPFPVEIAGTPTYIGPAFDPYHTMTAAKSPYCKEFHEDNCGLVVVQDKHGLIQISVHQGREGWPDLTETVKVIRIQEALARRIWKPEITAEELVAQGLSSVEPSWFFHGPWFIGNGSRKNRLAEPTELTLWQVYLCLQIGLEPNRFFQGGKGKPGCPRSHCLEDDCPWFWYHLQKCQQVRDQDIGE